MYGCNDAGMGNRLVMNRRKSRKYMQWCLGGASVLFVFVCYQNMSSLGKAPAMEQIGNFIREEIAVQAWKNCMPAMLREGQEAPVSSTC